MKSVINFLDKSLEEVLIGLCMGYFSIITFVQVIFRFVLQSPLSWSDETARYAFIWMIFLGSAVAVKKGSHIKVDILETFVKNQQVRGVLKLINLCLFLVFAVITTMVGVNICVGLMRFPFVSPSLEIPMFWVFLSLPVGMGLTTLRILQVMYKTYIKKEA